MNRNYPDYFGGGGRGGRGRGGARSIIRREATETAPSSGFPLQRWATLYAGGTCVGSI